MYEALEFIYTTLKSYVYEDIHSFNIMCLITNIGSIIQSYECHLGAHYILHAMIMRKSVQSINFYI